MSIRPALEALLEALASTDGPLATQLAAGLGRGDIERKLATLPGAVAAEVHDYFEWRNGLRPDRDREEELFPGAVMLSLDEALADHRSLVEMAQQIALQAAVPAASIWNERWLPLFRHPAGGAYYVTIAGTGATATAPIYAVTLEDSGAASLAFDSLTSLVRTVIACFTAGAYVAVDGAVREDPLRAAVIVRAQNPARVAAATTWIRPAN